MGAIYEVVHLETRQRRALKTMLPAAAADAELRHRFQLEAKVAVSVQTESIVEVFDAGIDDSTQVPFLVMELLEGEDLGRALDRVRRFSPHQVVFLLWQAALALDKVHALGIVHRDLKPENLFLHAPSRRISLAESLDFGIAKVVTQLTDPETTRSMGTAIYMAPEQMRGDGAIGSAADVYALAHVAYSLLVGEAYWQTEAREFQGGLSAHHTRRSRRSRPCDVSCGAGRVSLPKELDVWFAKATASTPSARFETATESIEELL